MATAFKCDHCGQLYEGQALHYGTVEAQGFVFSLLPTRRSAPGEVEVRTPFGTMKRPKPEEEPLDLCEPCVRDLGYSAAEQLTSGAYTKFFPEVDADPLAGVVKIMELGD